MRTLKTITSAFFLMLAISLSASSGGVKSAKEIKKDAPRSIGKLNVSEFTQADLKIVVQRHLDASPEDVWSFVGDSHKIPLYFKQVKKVTVDNSKANSVGQGEVRQCNFSGTNLYEDIVYVVPEKVFAYSAQDNDLISNHLAVVTLEEVNGQTVLTWYQYFDKGAKGFKSAMMKKMMPGLLKKGMKNIEKLAQTS